MIVLFFSLFGSPFVLAPGLPVRFRLPVVKGSESSAKAPTHVVDVVDHSQVYASDGLRKLSDLKDWLARQPKPADRKPVLLVRGGADAPIAVLTEIASAAATAGFEVLLAATEPVAGGAGKH
ncbi:MAG: hypothetical protein JNL39_07860 [Opitutaceae bacterium]|nr:hypothetical protein [Opitutaceae bacterium]